MSDTLAASIFVLETWAVPARSSTSCTPDLPSRTGASIRFITGEQLLEQNYPAIHTVGRAAARPPVLIDIKWAPEGETEDLPLLALVGKGES